MAVAKENRVDLEDLPLEVRLVLPVISDKGMTRFIKDVEKDCIMAALKRTGGNRRKASEILGMSVATLYRKLKAYKLLEK